MKTATLASVLTILCLPTLATAQATVQELNRAYVIEGTKLWAVNSGGGVAWSTTVSTLEHTAWHPCLDPVREVVWLVEQESLTLRRYSLQGNLEISIPISGIPYGTLLKSPAVDRDGNCYLGRIDPDFSPLGLLGYRDWLMKFNATGQLLWEIDITPTTWIQVFGGVFDKLWIDEDQHVWAYLGSERIIRYDPNGNELFHVFTSFREMVINPDRTIWHYFTDFNFNPTLNRLDKLRLDGTIVQQTITHVAGTQFVSHASGAPLRWEFPLGTPQTAAGEPLISEFCPSPDPSLGYAFIGCGEFGLGDPERLGDVRALALSPDGTRLVGIGQKYAGAGSLGHQPRLVEYGPYIPSPLPTLPNGYPVASFTDLGPPPIINSTGYNNTTNRYTAYDYCLITDPWGDVDHDGCLNRNEIMAGTNPCDPASFQAKLSLPALQPGGAVSFYLDAPGDAALAYYSVLSLLPHPYRLADDRLFGPSPLDPDPISPLWLTPGLVTAAAGTLDGNGQALITTALPADPQLVGLELRFGFATLDPSWSQGVKSLFGPVKLTIGTPGFVSP